MEQFNQALFSDKEMGMDVTEWDEIQEELRIRLAKRLSAGKVIWIPGNVPSLKNNKEIIQMWRTKSTCCYAPIYRSKHSGVLKAYCSKCKGEQDLKRPILMPHKRVIQYRKDTDSIFKQSLLIWRSLTRKMTLPYIVGIYQVRNSKRVFDYGNASEVLQDIMKDCDYYEDDHSRIMKPEHLGFHVDKDNPGVYILPLPKAFMREIIKMI